MYQEIQIGCYLNPHFQDVKEKNLHVLKKYLAEACSFNKIKKQMMEK